MVDAQDSLFVVKDYIVTHNSFLASSIAELGPTAYIDLPGENGGIVFRGAPWAKNITTYQVTNATQLDDIYWHLAKGDHPFRAVVLDSAAAYQTMLSRFLLSRPEDTLREIKRMTDSETKKGQTFSYWENMRDYTLEMGMFWYDLARPDRKRPMHVAITCQTVLAEDVKKDSNGNDVVVSSEWIPGLQPKSAYHKFLAIPSYVLHCLQEPSMTDQGEATMRHVVRCQRSPKHYAKIRVPMTLQGKIPPVLGRDKPFTLGKFVQTLGIPNPKD